MIRVFFDASALYAAVYSPHGASRELVNLSTKRMVEAVVCEEVFEETLRNLERKAPRFALSLYQVANEVPLIFSEPNEVELAAVRDLTALKDAYVVAAANKADCQYVISFDRAHLVGNTLIEYRLGIKVVTPGDLLAIIRSFQTKADAELTPPHEEHNSEKIQ